MAEQKSDFSITETVNDGLKRGYKITMPGTSYRSRIDAEIATIAPQVRMAGFRPGKVPAQLIHKLHGDAIANDVQEKIQQEAVGELIKSQNLKPAMTPTINLEKADQDGDVQIDVSLEVLPEIPAVPFEEVTIDTLVAKPKDQDIEDAIGNLTRSLGELEAAKEGHEAGEGDVITIAFKGTVDGEPFEGGSSDETRVTLGEGQFLPEFEQAIRGMKSGSETKAKVTFPEDYNAKFLAGKTAQFEIQVKSIEQRTEAEADDDMAKKLGLDSIDALRENVKTMVENDYKKASRLYLKRKLLDYLALQVDFEVPTSMLEAEFEQIWANLKKEEAAQKEQSPNEFPEDGEKEEEKRSRFRAIALRRIRLGLLLSDIGQQNNISVNQQEMNALIMQEAQRYPQEQHANVLRYFQQDAAAAARLKAPFYEEKVVDFLIAKIKVNESETDLESLNKALEEDAENA